MLLLKRLGTSAVLFVVLFFVFFFGTLIVGGGISGMKVSADHPNAQPKEAFELGRKAGEEFARKYTWIILLGSVGGALVASLGLSFSGILPWCRKQDEGPPRLP
jgi:hypothetical protein